MITCFDVKDIVKNNKLIGRGTSRKVYDYGDDKVIKIAFNKAGIAQNKAEATIYQNSQEYYAVIKRFAIVYEHNDDYSVIVMEKCKPIAGKKILRDLLIELYGDHEHDDPKDYYDDNIQELVSTYSLTKGDIDRINSWGINNEGDPVLIDYGLTNDVWEQHYRNRHVIFKKVRY